MKINDFRLERYFAAFEFNVKYMLSASDCESLEVKDLLGMADNESLDLWNNLKLGYTETKGHPVLRNEISDLYNDIGPENICVLVPEEGIFIVLNVILNSGDHVIVMDPAYQSLLEIPSAIGCEVTKWPIQLKNNKWFLDPGFLQNAIKKNTKLIIINFPHNPTGFIPDADDFNAIIETSVKNNIYLFSDEMYRHLELSKSHIYDSVADIYENGISLSGLSKSFGLPGLRTGWIAARNKELLGKIEKFKDYTTICNSAVSEILGIIALRKKDDIIATNLNLIIENIHIARDLFRSQSDLLTWIEPEGSSVAFPLMDKRFSVEEFCKKLVDQKSVLMLPASIFNYPGNHFRIGLGRKNFNEAIKVFETFLNENWQGPGTNNSYGI
jgi:aspartate/methionine/tyrosine aminotransferase